MNIAEILKHKSNGDAVTDLEATVTSCMDDLFTDGEGGDVTTTHIGTLRDESGTIAVRWGDTGGQHLRKGQRVRISAVPGARGSKLNGASLGEYKGKPQIRVYGEKLTILDGDRPASSAPTHPIQAALEGQAPPRQQQENVWEPKKSRAAFDPMSEDEAVGTLMRLMKSFVSRMTDLDFDESQHQPNLLADAPVHVLDVAQRCAVSIFIGKQKGDIQ